jgi:ribosome biogenesis GTPase / thiamine phosphate phosphatase
MALLDGLVVAAYGKRYEVELADKNRISCVTRGKKTDVACGDIVSIKLTDKKEGVIESSQPRSSLLYRSNAFKSKILASNVSQVVIVLATQPSFYESLLNRCLVAAVAANIKPLIVLNKCDLDDATDAKTKLKLYEKLGFAVLHLSAKQEIAALKPYLNNHQSVLVGQSGMGKSTIINALLPNQNVRTQIMSEALDSGKHTTTATHLYHLESLGLDENSSLIDSPGLQEFGLNHLSNEQIELAFIEFRPFLGKCRFNNCKHSHEPDCAILNAIKSGEVSQIRLGFYQDLSQELAHTQSS